MNNYPVWWDTTITVYNRYQDTLTQIVTWYRHVVDNCFWKNAGNKVVVGETVLETNNIICRIPKQDNFLEKFNWVMVPNDLMENYFTVGVGDIIVKGNVSDIINEYQSGHRSSDILNKYKALQGCLEVQSVAINTGVGRGNEHYYVSGI